MKNTLKKIAISISALSLLLPSVGFGAIAYDTSSSFVYCNGVSVCTSSLSASGSNITALVSITTDGNSSQSSPTSVTYGGISMTLAVSSGPIVSGQFQYTFIYYLKDAPSGSQTVSVTFPQTQQSYFNSYISATSFNGADGIGAISSASAGSGGSSISANLTTTKVNSIIFDTVYFNSSLGSVNAGQTAIQTEAYRRGTSRKVASTVGSYSLGWNGSGVVTYALVEILEKATQSATKARKIRGHGIFR